MPRVEEVTVDRVITLQVTTDIPIDDGSEGREEEEEDDPNAVSELYYNQFSENKF